MACSSLPTYVHAVLTDGGLREFSSIGAVVLLADVPDDQRRPFPLELSRRSTEGK